ncbi:MAG: hypothetical protein UY98_C0034G0008 [Candidatus Kaiserbacteria bacterium GW2011_GWA2_58_9]|uniref:DUF3298 domain-containing protein n=1 Tax=Candidatus Kaiserbacteria bacterium GW2011_GWA2_58_9 TaxID=1618672 RepID=A0A0G1YRY8_9BACT|nr:MAG: hypothetical protein UY98_C0034G0008 [Candidatus Kaiserbacteria bacterium GW2011_GWA2_58_9]
MGDAKIEAAPQTAEITTATEREIAEMYAIEARYPQFGIPAIDAEIKAVVEEAIAQFKKDAAEGPPPGSAVPRYEFASAFDFAYVGADIVSVELVVSTYLGGAHGISFVTGLNFEKSSGRELTLDDALALTDLTLAEVAEKAKAELSQKLGSDIIAPEGADAMPENYSTFVVSKDKVTFIFQVYQVAPYAAGPQKISFPRVQ